MVTRETADEKGRLPCQQLSLGVGCSNEKDVGELVVNRLCMIGSLEALNCVSEIERI